ncbi:MAG: alkaline phosphatase [Alistipes sp.]|nr:alkaline phosphatase [Alistipes sp.]
MKQILLLVSSLILLAGVSSCTNENGGVRGVKHVVMIGLDGLAGNTVEAANMPTVKMMMENGAWTLQARSILPSSSACNWASMYMGVGPEMHGYNTWGSRKPDFPSIALGENGIFPTIFTVLREHNPEINTCALYEWATQGDLIDNKAVSYHKHVPMGESRSADITEAYISYLKENKPQFSICIFDSPDAEGHGHGWGSEPYMNRLPELDAHIAKIVEATKQAGMYDNTIFMIVSDHGGINKGHGGTTMDEMEAPLIFFGPGVKKGYKIEQPVVRYDTAPTIAYIFGAKTPDVWRGRAIVEIFE